jgi:hypothetical protein
MNVETTKKVVFEYWISCFDIKWLSSYVAAIYIIDSSNNNKLTSADTHTQSQLKLLMGSLTTKAFA